MTDDIFDRMLRAGQLAVPPLEIKVLEHESSAGEDAVIEASWKGKTCRFVAEMKNNSKPQSLMNAVFQAKGYGKTLGLPAMVIAPYLSAEKLDQLLAQGVSAIDFCGNAAIEALGKFYFYKSGNPNRFPDSAPIRSAYRGDGSLVARVLLIQSEFKAVGDILKSIKTLEGSLTFGAVSKVLKRLEEDLVIERIGRGIVKVIDPNRLLEGLLEAWEPPKVDCIWTGKIAIPDEQLFGALMNVGGLIRTGESSASEYAVWAGEPILSCYCREAPEAILGRLNVEARETQAFANLRLIQTRDQRVFFDPRPKLAASPIQAFLEMAKGDKRQKEVAEQIKLAILPSAEAGHE